MSEYYEIYVNISKSAWMAFVLDLSIVIFKSAWMVFVLQFPIVIPYLKEHEVVFLIRQNSIFYGVVGSIWFVFCFRLNIFTNKISNLLLRFEAEGGGGYESLYALNKDLNILSWQFHWDNWMVCITHVEQLYDSSVSLKAVNTRNLLSLTMEIVSMILRSSYIYK